MDNGYLLMLCIIIFTFAIASIFILQPKETKKFDKQGVVKYNDNDYWGKLNGRLSNIWKT